jgi:cytochrome c peroxidase
LLSAWVAAHACAAADLADPPTAILGEEPISPTPPAVALDLDKVRLGEQLFYDVQLSRGDVVACASCHRLDRGGDDDRARSPSSADGAPLAFNTLTVFNAALSFRLNWRGNYRSLEEQNEAVLLDPRLMNTTWGELLGKLRAAPDYRTAFAAAYGSDPERAQVLDALAAFQRSLLTPNARFDRYLRGERDAITETEERGYQLFKAYGCVTCHQGVNVGGNLFQKFGIFEAPFPSDRDVAEADLGRFAITGEERDRFVFRVPSLRNVAVTAPYFHDGGAPTLERAVEVMGRKQLGRTLTEQEIGLIVGFLRTLTGEYRGRTLDLDAGRPP